MKRKSPQQARNTTRGRQGRFAVAGVYRQGRFLCDTAHDGFQAEVRLNLTAALSVHSGGTPALGDLDGDHRAEACVFTDSRQICGFFARTGGQPLRVVDQSFFGLPGEVPLLGDLDGF